MAKKPLELKGLKEVRRAMNKYQKQYPAASANAIYAEALEVEREATKRAPIEFGVLRSSAYTTVPTQKDPIAEAGFGTKYAALQHEEIGFYHPQGEAKYLENAVDSRRAGMLQRLAERIKKFVAKGMDAWPTAMSNTRPVVKPEAKKSKKKKIKSRKKKQPTKKQIPKKKG